MSATDSPPACRRPTIPAGAARGQRCSSRCCVRTFLIGLGIVLFWVACALFGEHFAPYDPLADDIINALAPPSAEHWFGTDQIGRDVFSRVIVGSRDILTVAPLATLLGTVAGTALGLFTGYFRGIVDDVVSRILEAFMAIPVVIVALLAIVALGTSKTTVVIVIGLSFAPLIARTVRSAVLAERELDYVAAAQLRHESALHIMFVEILPNVVPPILVETDGPPRLCDLHRRHAELHRLRHPAALARLGAQHLQQLRHDRRRLLVDGAVRRARHRLAGHRRQSGDRRRPGGAQ